MKLIQRWQTENQLSSSCAEQPLLNNWEQLSLLRYAQPRVRNPCVLVCHCARTRLFTTYSVPLLQWTQLTKNLLNDLVSHDGKKNNVFTEMLICDAITIGDKDNRWQSSSGGQGDIMATAQNKGKCTKNEMENRPFAQWTWERRYIRCNKEHI